MGRFIQKISSVVAPKQVSVKFLAINFERARWLHEVVRATSRGCCGGNFLVFGTTFVLRTIGENTVLLRPPFWDGQTPPASPAKF